MASMTLGKSVSCPPEVMYLNAVAECSIHIYRHEHNHVDSVASDAQRVSVLHFPAMPSLHVFKQLLAELVLCVMLKCHASRIMGLGRCVLALLPGDSLEQLNVCTTTGVM